MEIRKYILMVPATAAMFLLLNSVLFGSIIPLYVSDTSDDYTATAQTIQIPDTLGVNIAGDTSNADTLLTTGPPDSSPADTTGQTSEDPATRDGDRHDAGIAGNASADVPSAGNGDSGFLSEVQDIVSPRKIFLSVFVLLVIYLVLRFITSLIDNLAERFTSNRLIFKRSIPVLKITFWTAGIYFVIAGILDPPIETIITVSATIGIAVGFASQDILRNVFGGIMIILDKPFQIGDKIDIGGYYGEVIEIGLRSVRIVTADDSVVSIPNGELMNKAVSNSNSSALDCQVVAEIYLPADTDLMEVRELAYRAAATSKYVYLNKPIVVNALNEIHHDRFVVKLRVKAYVLDIRYEFRFKSDMTEIILAELKCRGILGSDTPGVPGEKEK
jgi:small-conductance mechanosensitive channel